MKNIYLDVCTYCRPFDNQDALRIRLETEAFYLIMQHIQKNRYRSIISPVHIKEIDAICVIEERLMLKTLLKQFAQPLVNNLSEIRSRADYLHQLGFGIADAAHVAYAENLADFFITCDDKLLKKCKKETTLKITAMNPLEFILTEELQ
jgi:predicted nucleic acid-binding protein